MGLPDGLLTALAVFELELRRFLRRRETLWLLVLLVLPSALLALPSALVPASVAGDVLLPAQLARLAVSVGAAPLAYFLAFRATAAELESNAFVLLRQGPAAMWAVHLGKGAAVAVECLWLLAACLLAPLAVLHQGGPEPGETVAPPLLAFAYALGFVPEGMLAAFVHRASSRPAYAAFRLATVVRVVAPLVALDASIPQELRRQGFHVGTVLVAWLGVTAGQGTMDGSWLAGIDPAGTWLRWQAVTTLPYLLLLPRRR